MNRRAFVAAAAGLAGLSRAAGEGVLGCVPWRERAGQKVMDILQSLQRCLMTFNQKSVRGRVGLEFQTFPPGALLLKEYECVLSGEGSQDMPDVFCIRREQVVCPEAYGSAVWPEWLELTVLSAEEQAKR